MEPVHPVNTRLRAGFPLPVPIEVHPNKEHLVVEAATPLKDLEVGLLEKCKSQKLAPYSADLARLVASQVSEASVLVPIGIGSFG